MTSKINVSNIVKGHLGTLRNNQNGKIAQEDILVFYILPFLGGLLSLTFNLSSASANIITILSIFVGLLLNLLVITFDMMGKYSKSSAIGDREKLRATLIEEIYLNISYAILVSIAAIAFVAPFSVKFIKKVTDLPISGYAAAVLAFIACYLIFHFSLTILMVLKRIYTLLDKEVKK